MDDLLSAALSESGLDLSLDDGENINHLDSDGVYLQDWRLTGPNIGGDGSSVKMQSAVSYKDDDSFNLITKPNPGNTSVSEKVSQLGSLPSSESAICPAVKQSQASAVKNGTQSPPNSSLDFLLSKKKTIIIKNLPSGITAQALNRGGKLPIKLVKQSESQKTQGITPSIGRQEITNHATLSSSLDYQSSSVISISVGKDRNITKPTDIFTGNQKATESKTKVIKDVVNLTKTETSILKNKESKKGFALSERYLITPLNAHKSNLNFRKQAVMDQSPTSSSNVSVRTVTFNSTKGLGSGNKMGLVVSSNSLQRNNNAKTLQTGYMLKPVTSVKDRRVSDGPVDPLNPVFGNSAKSFIPGSKVGSFVKAHSQLHLEEDDDEEETEEELGHTDTYSNYIPSKLKIGLPHPDPVVETSSLASVEPPDILYQVCIPERSIDMCSLSALQLEAVTYACQQHDTFLRSGERAGFLIGDGAGVGKGRTVAAVIFENYLLGRKRSLWFSVSNDLKFDAQRDLKDIGAGNIPVHSLNKFRYIKINSKENGYVRKGVIFATYSALIGESQNRNKYHTRLKQILHWCGKDFDGVIVLDECHKAKNLVPSGSSKPTKTGVTVLELQKQLPKARIIYCSATGASEPRNMAYMSRLGIWGSGTPFPDFQTFIQAVEKRGVGAMEIVAMDMKLRGMYMARQLSFQGVGFCIREIPLANDFKLMYNRAVKLWCAARERFQKAANLMSGDPSFSKFMWGQFWSSHQRFFKYLCIAAKVKEAVRSAQEAVKMGKCVVIGLQSTGEARTLDALEETGGELTDFVSTAKGVFSALIEKHFPAPNRAKMAGMFGLSFDSDLKNMVKEKHSKRKRKRVKSHSSNSKKRKKKQQAGSDEDDMSDSSHDSEFSDLNIENLSSSGLSSSEEEEEEDDLEDEDDEEINPFGDSDSDDDPWLKKGMQKTKVKKKKKHKENKDKEEEQMKSMADSALRALGITPKTPSSKTKGKDYHSQLSSSMSNFPSATSEISLPGMDAYDRVSLMKQELLDMLEELGPILPPNTLDELIEELGGPENVAEMTGRKGRVVSNNDGNVQYESRCEMDVPLEILNLTEKKRFMEGEKYVAIISEAASSGISLQADKRVPNQKRRVHITLEIPWSADRAIQQFGRTHRSNQVSAPEYVFLISELAGERRFASIVAKRLECLGALTHGDRRATESRDLSQFNIDNKYGRLALEAVMKSIIGIETPLIKPPRDGFFSDCKQALVGVGLVIVSENFSYATLDKDYNSLPKFLNRLLGVEVDLQNEIFGYFSDTLAEMISRAKKEGLWDMGILDIISEGQIVKKLETHNYIGSFSTGTATAQLHKVSAERGLKWQLAVDLWSQLSTPDEGFYVSSKIRNGKRLAILVKFSSMATRKGVMNIYRPNLGQQVKTETLTELKEKYKKVIPDEAKDHWENQYTAATSMCSHKYWRGRCRNTEVGIPCDIGLRSRTFYILGGSVLSVWSRVERILMTHRGGQDGKMQLIRVKTADGSKLVGMLIPKNCVSAIKRDLSIGATCYSNTYCEADSK